MLSKFFFSSFVNFYSFFFFFFLIITARIKYSNAGPMKKFMKDFNDTQLSKLAQHSAGDINYPPWLELIHDVVVNKTRANTFQSASKCTTPHMFVISSHISFWWLYFMAYTVAINGIQFSIGAFQTWWLQT